MMPRRQGVSKCDSFESMCCELRMHVCDLETNCFFGEIFFEKGQKSFQTGTSCSWSPEGKEYGTRGEAVFLRSPNLNHGS